MVDTVVVIAGTLRNVSVRISEDINDESAAYDCSAHPEALSIVPVGTGRADCNGEDEKAISEEENRP